MIDLILIRHAATAYNREGRYQGKLDVPLDRRGILQAIELGHAVRRERLAPSSVWTSDLSRARLTAMLVFPGVPARPDPRLRELDFGEFEGLTAAQNTAAHGGRYTRWLERPEELTAPGGESLSELRGRVMSWFGELPPGIGRVAAVTHFGPLHALVAGLLEIGFLESRARFPVEPGEALRLRVANGTAMIRKPGWASRSR